MVLQDYDLGKITQGVYGKRDIVGISMKGLPFVCNVHPSLE